MITLQRLLIVSALTIIPPIFAQKKQVVVKYTDTPIEIDANLDEEPWQGIGFAGGFWQYFPSDKIQVENQTEIKMLFDDKNLYVGIKVYSSGKDYIVPSLRRDFRAGGSDNVTLLFDTFNDGSNAFVFGSNPYGVKREFLLSGGGKELRGFNSAWDVKWKAESKIYDGYYICEWEIPLYAFKYKEGETRWRFNSYQFDAKGNERNTWINIPQNQFIFNLAYMGDMVFERPLGKSRSPIALIPYVNSGIYKDYETDNEDVEFKIGGDAKMTIGNSMNLDLTINPDFSQVEVDRQVTNLSRFAIALPERRQFFIENSDLFGDFGTNRDARTFFSRRIGIARDLDNNTIQNEIIGGARLSGKLTNDLRIGLLSVQTAEDRANEIPTNNNSVLALQHKLFNRSNLSFLFINRSATKEYGFLNDSDGDESNNTYNRVIGLDYNLASKNNSWTGKYFFHKSFSPETDNKDYVTGASTTYNSRYLNMRLSGLYIGDNFQSDLGFIRRTGILKFDPQIQGNLWPKKGVFNKHSLSFTPIVLFQPEHDYENSDYFLITRWGSNFRSQAEFKATMFNMYARLYDDFDPTRTAGAVKLPANSDYHYTSVELEYQSDKRKQFSYKVQPTYGGFYNGKKFSLEADLNWRLQPYFVASAQFRYDNIDLPDPYPDAKIWLVGPRFDTTFNKKLFWTTLVQYSSQSDNIGVNSRLQWRFRPLSDLFIVYNDNYHTTVFSPRSRSITVKFTYRLDI
ncbi:MAG: hydrolase [Maribacter sp.]|nr:MAG: hydrolase [Maribacter sp.]